ncbi:unnamed protein product [Cylindrotheca closterium]|uniref:Uncharacterized protein n=1 Tax=Cylindrotheca closterium TaxID=2856 RepID=A0AAD2CB45_9STRA|nr:unnamed protein product [Cylindrotheca closterium]
MSGRRLNHQGFSTILQKHSLGGGSKKGSSTKEIARKAVEEEWKRNQKRKRSGLGGDSSDEEDGDERDRGKRGRKSQKDEEEEDDEFEFSQDYRDRAKERREGKPPADTFTDTKEESAYPTDPALPPPTKGLNLSLARKLRKEMKEAGANGSKESNRPAIFTELPTMEQAISTLESIASEEISLSASFLIDRTSLDYIQGLVKLQNQAVQSQPIISCTLAGKKMQRSRLVVSLNGNISDLKRSWEIPREVTNSNPSSNMAQPCMDLPIIQKIEAILKTIKKSQNPFSSRRNNKILDTFRPCEGEVEAGKTSSKTTPENTIQQSEAQASDEDDDDIFGGLDDYSPPAPSAKQ